MHWLLAAVTCVVILGEDTCRPRDLASCLSPQCFWDFRVEEACVPCGDDDGFIDEHNYPCTDWVGYSCPHAVDEFFYTEQGRRAVLANCPLSCRLCSGSQTGQTPLFWASSVAVATSLIEGRAEIHTRDSAQQTALHWATIEPVAHTLIEHRADVDATDESGSTPLFLALQSRRTNMVKDLIHHRADVNAQNNAGERPLAFAYDDLPWRETSSIADDLLKQRAEVHAKDGRGRTALHVASNDTVGDHFNVVRALLGKLADVHATDDIYVRTPLFYAAAGGSRRIVEQLIQYGAEVQASDLGGFTARDVAETTGHGDLLPLLPQRSVVEAYEHYFRSLMTLRGFASLAGTLGAFFAWQQYMAWLAQGIRDKHLHQQASRGALILAASTMSTPRNMKLVRAIRLLETFFNTAVLSHALLYINPLFFLPTVLVLFALLHFLKEEGTARITKPEHHRFFTARNQPYLSFLAFSGAILHREDWKERKAAKFGVTVARVIVVLLVAVIANMSPSLQNRPGILSANMISHNDNQGVCFTMPFDAAILRRYLFGSWSVSNGTCTKDGDGCITSPAFPNPYPYHDKCRISTPFVSSRVTAVNFSLYNPGGHLTIAGQEFRGSTGPHKEVAAPWSGIQWEVIYNLNRTGWRLCPENDYCTWHPPVQSAWRFFEIVCYVVGFAWPFAGLLLLLQWCYKQRRGAQSDGEVNRSLMNIHANEKVNADLRNGGEDMAMRDEGEEIASLTIGRRLQGKRATAAIKYEDVELLAAEIDSICERKPERALDVISHLEGKFGKVKPKTKADLYTTTAIFATDVVLDLNTVHMMILSGHTVFATLLGLTTCLPLILSISRGHMRAFPGAVRQTLKTGVPTDAFFEMFDYERGAEAPLSLVLSTYAMPCFSKTPYGITTALLSVCTSCWSLNTYVFDTIEVCQVFKHEAAISLLSSRSVMSAE